MTISKFNKFLLLSLSQVFLLACGSGSSNNEATTPNTPPPITSVPDVTWPEDDIALRAALRDTNGETLSVSGTINIKPPQDATAIFQYDLYWFDTLNEILLGEVLQTLLVSEFNEPFSSMEIDGGLIMPNEDVQLAIVAKDINESHLEQFTINFQDFTGNALISGKGGTIAKSWVYGEDRPYLNAHVETINGNDICSFDNGLVMIIDMQNERDRRDDILVDDDLYPAYSFNCTNDLTHNGKEIWGYLGNDEDDIIVAYSPLNDALHYATITYDMMFKYLGRPPFNEKYRLRVHYGEDFYSDIFWDGAYANFGDEYYTSSYGSVGLDIVAHELGHGFLNHNSPLKVGLATYHNDALSLHEGFADMSGAAAKYFYNGETNWNHGAETHSPNAREGNKVVVMEDGLPSYLDYTPTTKDRYKNMGMVTYPFYLLTEKWGMDRSYPIMLDAAQYCWQPFMIFPEIAQCILDAAINRNEPAQDVIEAFKAVKIKLFDEGTLAHFDAVQIKRNISFSDTSVSTSETNEWHWDFGDGNTSTEQNPVHDYVEGGFYQPVLTVTDLNGDVDTYTRLLDVFTDYCAPAAGGFELSMTQLSINGTTLDVSDQSVYDYTNTVFNVPEDNILHIVTQGLTGIDSAEDWGIWLDINEDGIFDNKPNSVEILYNDGSEDSENYGLDVQITLPQPLPASALRLRITGSYGIPGPCKGKIKNTVDVYIQKN